MKAFFTAGFFLAAVGLVLTGRGWCAEFAAASPEAGGNTPPPGAAWAEPAAEGNSRAAEVPRHAPAALGNSLAAGSVAPAPQGVSPTAQAAETYEENSGLEDFQVHFFVSLPFTALYSYVAVTTLDGLVQGHYPATFREADMWVVTGLALGSSLAVALGSLNRVPDQSVPRLAENDPPDFSAPAQPLVRVTLLRVEY